MSLGHFNDPYFFGALALLVMAAGARRLKLNKDIRWSDSLFILAAMLCLFIFVINAVKNYSYISESIDAIVVGKSQTDCSYTSSGGNHRLERITHKKTCHYLDLDNGQVISVDLQTSNAVQNGYHVVKEAGSSTEKYFDTAGTPVEISLFDSKSIKRFFKTNIMYLVGGTLMATAFFFINRFK